MVVQEIKEIQQVLQLKFRLRMTWFVARLDFFNIKLDETMNVISLDELNRIWLPVIIFHNTEEGQITINDGKSFATINRTGQGTGSDSSISEDIDIYKGSENSISISRLYNIDFFCDYDMRWYPFLHCVLLRHSWHPVHSNITPKSFQSPPCALLLKS